MEITLCMAYLPGPVRPNNEDYLGFWEPSEEEHGGAIGAVAVIADGVGGQDRGEVAAKLAVEMALRLFREAKENIPPGGVLWDIINAANLAVYDKGMDQTETMAAWPRRSSSPSFATRRSPSATSAIAVPTWCRRQGRQITADHTYAAMQQKLGLISEQEATHSEMRSMLMRSVGREPTVQVDLYTVRVNQGDFIVQCSDGVAPVRDRGGDFEIVTPCPPDEACKQLIALAEKRGTEDNLTVQIIRIDRVEEMMFYRGLPIYREVCPAHEPRSRSRPDAGRPFSRSPNWSAAAAWPRFSRRNDLKTGETVAHQDALHAIRERPGLLRPLPARGGDRQDAGASLHPADHARRGQRAGPTSSWNISRARRSER